MPPQRLPTQRLLQQISSPHLQKYKFTRKRNVTKKKWLNNNIIVADNNRETVVAYSIIPWRRYPHGGGKKMGP
jgi:hypothetical protein